MKKLLVLFAILCLFVSTGSAQDRVTLTNGDAIVGDVKSMKHAVLVIETDYSDSDFTIDWKDVQDLTTSGTYIIGLAGGKKVDGTITIVNQTVTITDADGGQIENMSHLKVIYLNAIDKGFWDKVNASIDGGFTHSKASNNNQFTLRGTAAYMSTKINPDLYANFVQSAIDANDSVRVNSKRRNYGGNFRMFFSKSWFAITGADFLTSDEQGLDLRSTYSLGVGYFPISTYRMLLNVSTGIALNNEILSDDVMGEDNTSTEGFVSMEYNAFGLDDISIVSSVKYYPSLSDGGRNRLNASIDLKLDLPKDFYIGLGYTVNYDSEPTGEDIPGTDYVVQTTVGWSL
ncbi:Putative salt-induced outer membrane protein YdiY [Reichenbachiella agariperforans]|uniref:Putative salt-induced outer membrane protein YdiY n=1 Tax=Reichenbachiella agariperforans TaxID=156994 RepID=A0A1M6WJ38_REIAG|nr:DUF481 domain-containing protein [Reichenbachiella agariperforans]SHK93701.1 Putative salt-induced outer membrane protein YdiY [Reichenbachiella agariperforans]